MSKMAQQIIIILAVLLLSSFGLAIYYWMQSDQLQKNNVALARQLEDFSKREKEYLSDNVKLKADVEKIEKDKVELQDRLKRFKDVDLEKIEDDLKKLTDERDDWKKRVEGLNVERDKLVKKLSEQQDALNALANESPSERKEKSDPAATPAPMQAEKSDQTPLPSAVETVKTEEEKTSDLAAQQQQDSYWAQVLREKANLQLKVENLTATLSTTNVELVEMKKKNSDIQLALSELKSEKEAIEREIKHGKDLADTLSLELARAQNEKKFLNGRVEKLLGDNSALREQIKQLTSTKIALEKSIVRLQDEKKETEKKLMETENVIQSRIDQIWSIKESLDKDLKPQTRNSGQIELPPIVVAPQGQEQTPVANPSVDRNVGGPPGFHGNVVSINRENNFVIVDIGEDSGLQVGETLSVYRGTEYVAGLEVIQLRKDIAAADIKEKVAEIKIGDVVR